MPSPGMAGTASSTRSVAGPGAGPRLLPSTATWVLLVILVVLPWIGGSGVQAMRPSYVEELRRETVDMFYHGYSNYMRVAFPEDEVSGRRA